MTTFNSFIGQPQAVELLTQAIALDRVAPAYLFAGASGVGKRLAAEAFVKLLVSDSRQRVAQRNHPDVLWVEPTYLHQGKRLSPAEAETAGVKKKAPPQVRLDQVREISLFLSRPLRRIAQPTPIKGLQGRAFGIMIRKQDHPFPFHIPSPTCLHLRKRNPPCSYP